MGGQEVLEQAMDRDDLAVGTGTPAAPSGAETSPAASAPWSRRLMSSQGQVFDPWTVLPLGSGPAGGWITVPPEQERLPPMVLPFSSSVLALSETEPVVVFPSTIPAMPAGSMITRSVALAFRKQRCDNTP